MYLSFSFEIITDSWEVAKNNTEVACHLHQQWYSPAITFYITIGYVSFYYIIFDELFLAVPVLTCSLSLYLLFYFKPDKERIKLH